MQSEIWEYVQGYEGLYSISSLGKVFSHRSSKCLRPIITKQGYCRVHLANAGSVKTIPIHRLVAEAFILNPENKPTVNHINENKCDNRAANLEWATNYEQNVHGTRIERVKASTDYKSRCIDYAVVASKHDYHSINKKQMKPVLQFDKDGNFIARFDGVSIAARSVGINTGHLCSCLKGQRRHCGGYKWKYA